MKIIEGPVSFFEGFGANGGVLIFAMGVVVIYIVFQFLPTGLGDTIPYIIKGAPIYLPIVTFLLFFEKWLDFVHKQFDLSQGRTTIEIKLPQDVFKSPEAMELILSQLHQTAGPDNHIQTYWDGKNPPTYALEIVSRGGDVRFYVNTPKKKFKNLFETQFYAQYPGIEVTELDIDYTSEIVWDPDRFSIFSFHFGLKKADAYPIKTYIEYGMDKLPKEEEKTDPITSILEALGSLGPGEHMWIQILITANRETNFKTGSLHASPDWKEAARGEITKILEKAQKRVGAESPNLMQLTDAEKKTIDAIERSIGKNAFDTVIRGMYLAQKNAFNGERISALSACWRTFDDQNRNSIGVRWRTDTDWPWWQDRGGHVTTHMKKEELDEYKRRAYTHHNSADTPKVMTTEELATIFHLPGKVAFTPALARIPSKRAEPPSNLPIG